ncbi:hypothetical protein CFIO01_02892 [Colletotrichum fioriniae PJ7]|uniref:Uncharacterized protein n=1 Tax=Colletotrichum fioriniae PJ7 TaxID=1445577 RepID=A0A010QEU8_9PEZI|nr:hypothetical protein CFIO01_02892 [Colletotrichum fioriniae PJ7]
MSSHRSSDPHRKSSRKTTTVPTPSSYNQGQAYVNARYNDGPATTPQQYAYQSSSSTSTMQPYYTDNSSQPSWNTECRTTIPGPQRWLPVVANALNTLKAIRAPRNLLQRIGPTTN